MRLPQNPGQDRAPEPFPELAELLDPNSFRFRRLLAAPAESTWERLTTPAGLQTWLAVADLHAEVGSAFSLRFEGHDGISGEATTGETVTGEVVTADIATLLELTWHENDVDSFVRIEVDPVGPSSRLILTHRDLPADRRLGFAAGWHQHLARLAAVLDGSPDPGWDDERQIALVVAYRTEVGPRP